MVRELLGKIWFRNPVLTSHSLDWSLKEQWKVTPGSESGWLDRPISGEPMRVGEFYGGNIQEEISNRMSREEDTALEIW